MRGHCLVVSKTSKVIGHHRPQSRYHRAKIHISVNGVVKLKQAGKGVGKLLVERIWQVNFKFVLFIVYVCHVIHVIRLINVINVIRLIHVINVIRLIHVIMLYSC